MLLLRAAVSIAAVVQGVIYLADANLTAATFAAAMVYLLAGAALLIGFLTPIAGVLLGLGAIGFSVFPAPGQSLFEGKLSVIFAAIMTAAVVFLGPGAFSLDARLFGRREIIIPR